MRIEIKNLTANCQNAIISGIEAGGPQGINYWCNRVRYHEGDWLPIDFHEYDDPAPGLGYWHTLTHDKLLTGVELMANRYPHMFGHLLNENEIDGPLGDLLIQCCLFGEEKYA